MKLYLANCSRQKHIFNYKVPEKTQQFMQPIPAGSQIMLNYPEDVVMFILQQHEPYGLQHYRKVDKNFAGTCYAIDEPISAADIMNGVEQKTANLKQAGEDLLNASAVAYNNALDNAAAAAGEKPLGEGLVMEITGEAVNTDQPDPPSLDKKINVKKSR